jgi:hypothetical protein
MGRLVYRRAMEVLSSNSVASGRGVHEELSRLHPQDDDDIAEVLPDPFSLPRIKLRASKVDIMEVVAICPHRKFNPHVDGWRFETLRALGSSCTLTGLAEAIVNAEVPQGVASLLASATLIRLDKLDPEQRRAQEQELCYPKGTLRPKVPGTEVLRAAKSCRSSPLVSVVLLVADVELHFADGSPRPKEQVDVGRAPFPGAFSRLSARGRRSMTVYDIAQTIPPITYDTHDESNMLHDALI